MTVKSLMLQKYPDLIADKFDSVTVKVTEVVTVGGGDVHLVEMSVFHTSASSSLQMNQIKTFVLLFFQMKQTKTSA